MGDTHTPFDRYLYLAGKVQEEGVREAHMVDTLGGSWLTYIGADLTSLR
jgi:hypothetical protein